MVHHGNSSQVVKITIWYLCNFSMLQQIFFGSWTYTEHETQTGQKNKKSCLVVWCHAKLCRPDEKVTLRSLIHIKSLHCAQQVKESVLHSLLKWKQPCLHLWKDVSKYLWCRQVRWVKSWHEPSSGGDTWLTAYLSDPVNTVSDHHENLFPEREKLSVCPRGDVQAL